MSFALTLAFMFLVFWRPQEWLVRQLYGLPILDGIVYLSLLALLVEINSGAVRLARTPVVGLAIGLWFATLFSHVPHTYFQGILDTIPESFKLCFFLLLLVAVLDRVSRARGVVLVLVGATCLMAVHALLQQRFGRGFGGQAPLAVFNPRTGQWTIRTLFYGIFGDPNDLAQMLATAIPLAFAVPRRLNLGGLLVAGGIATLLFLALLSTHSRGGMVALAAVAVAMVFLILPARWLPWLWALALFGGLIAAAFRGAGLLDPSAQERVVFWGLANRVFKQNLFFGLGFGMFWQVTAGSRAAHNAFVSCYTEVGLFGYWFWFNLLSLGVLACWRARVALERAVTPAQRYLRRLAGLAIAAVAGFAAGGYFLSRAFIFPFFFLFGLLNAVGLIAERELPREHPPLINVRHDLYLWGTIGALFSVAYIYVSILILNRVYYG